MKVKIKIERIDPLREGTSKNGYAYANRTVAVSHTENVGENSTYKHTFTCDLHGDFARQFEEKVTVGMEVEADSTTSKTGFR